MGEVQLNDKWVAGASSCLLVACRAPKGNRRVGSVRNYWVPRVKAGGIRRVVASHIARTTTRFTHFLPTFAQSEGGAVRGMQGAPRRRRRVSVIGICSGSTGSVGGGAGGRVPFTRAPTLPIPGARPARAAPAPEQHRFPSGFPARFSRRDSAQDGSGVEAGDRGLGAVGVWGRQPGQAAGERIAIGGRWRGRRRRRSDGAASALVPVSGKRCLL